MLEFNATFLVAMVSFVVFIIIMNAIFYKPILGIIDERERYIDNLKNDAKNSDNLSQKILEDKEKRLSDANMQAKRIVSEELNLANANSKKRTENAKSESDSKIKSAKDELFKQEAVNAEVLQNNVDELSDLIVAKILNIDEVLK